MERHLSLLNRAFFHWSAVTALVLLSGCGGGGGGNNDGPAANTAARTQGLYEGAVVGYAGLPYQPPSDFQFLLLEEGTYYLLTGTGSGGALEVSGLLQGSGTETSATRFVSTNTRDFGYEPPIPFNLELQTDLSVDYILASTSDNSIYLTFNGRPRSTSIYDYDLPAQLSQVAGSWDFAVDGNVLATLVINPDGTYSGSDVDGCSSTGTLTPRPSGKNVFNLTSLDGPAPCPDPGSTAAGVAIVTTPVSGPRRLYLMGTAPNRSEGFALSGTPTPP
jgi:hypothetical protein